MPRSRRHYRDALARVLRASGLASVPEAALLVATLKDLAEQLDNGAGGRVMVVWISANKDLQRFLDGRTAGATKSSGRAAKKPAAEVEKPATPPAPPKNDLQKFKEAHGIPA